MANIRKATAEDIAQAVRIYEHVLDNERQGNPPSAGSAEFIRPRQP